MEGAMLLSYVNMKLRDEEITFEELCAELGWEKEKVEAELEAFGYRYNEAQNRFC